MIYRITIIISGAHFICFLSLETFISELETILSLKLIDRETETDLRRLTRASLPLRNLMNQNDFSESVLESDYLSDSHKVATIDRLLQ